MTVKGLFLYYLDNLWKDLRILIIYSMVLLIICNIMVNIMVGKADFVLMRNIETVMFSDKFTMEM